MVMELELCMFYVLNMYKRRTKYLGEHGRKEFASSHKLLPMRGVMYARVTECMHISLASSRSRLIVGNPFLR
jgi:hypothetical protein